MAGRVRAIVERSQPSEGTWKHYESGRAIPLTDVFLAASMVAGVDWADLFEREPTNVIQMLDKLLR